MNNSYDSIKTSHTLNGNAESLRAYYRAWASRYDADVASENYRGPEVMATLTDLARRAYIGYDKKKLEILDAGCGTGLVGIALKQAGFLTIDGNDLSHEMAEVARRTEVYREINGGVDLDAEKLSLPTHLYDIVVCCGVFTVGHVSPYALRNVASYARLGGVLVVSTRNSYLHGTDFEAVSKEICASGYLDLISSVEDANYITEEQAHYWLYRVLKTPLPPAHSRDSSTPAPAGG